jgi:galactokinase
LGAEPAIPGLFGRAFGFMISIHNLQEKFKGMFGGAGRVFRAPGRVNLIGEHVDYNEGWVLPFAIDRSCFVLARSRGDRRLRIRSEQMQETAESHLDDPKPSEHHWSNYARGMAWALLTAGKEIRGADILISTDIPLGAGLSSSAALEVAMAFALLRLSGLEMERVELARACQRAENEYVGMRCGIMDQLTACCGHRGKALLIDCRSLEIEFLPLDESEVAVVVANTMAKHQLAASSEYNRRRKECEEAVERLRAVRPEVKALRDVTWPEIEGIARDWPENVRRRARHVTREIARTHEAAAALRRHDFTSLGRLISESHASLAQDYEVSSPELNRMVQMAIEFPGCFGARMIGAGFGGCTVNLVKANAAPDFAARLQTDYEAQTGVLPEIYHCRASPGVEEVV